MYYFRIFVGNFPHQRGEDGTRQFMSRPHEGREKKEDVGDFPLATPAIAVGPYESLSYADRDGGWLDEGSIIFNFYPEMWAAARPWEEYFRED